MPASDLLTRAVSSVTPKPLAEAKLKSGKPMRLYFGIDPTGAQLHLGHSVPLRKMRAFQDAGHHVILVIGSFTAMIGDPTGKDEMRKMLTRQDVQKNFENYLDQAKLILDIEKLEVRYNHEWLEKLHFEDIIKLASNFTVQQMIERDMFQMRLNQKMICKNCGRKTFLALPLPSDFREQAKKGSVREIIHGQIIQISNEITCDHCNAENHLATANIVDNEPIGVHEFFYPLMVGYDSVMLDVDVELGGNDQLFNMLAGRTLQTAFGKRDKFVLTTKLIEGTDGRKMSKTYENCIYVTDSPKEMYGKTMRILDNLIPLYMECCTDIPMDEVKQAEKAIKNGSINPKELKMRLARELVTMYHGKDAGEAAEKEFQTIFKDHGVPDDIAEVKVGEGTPLVDVLLANKLVPSKSEFRRLVEQKGVHVNDKTVVDLNAKVEKGIVRVGKRRFLRILPS